MIHAFSRALEPSADHACIRSAATHAKKQSGALANSAAQPNKLPSTAAHTSDQDGRRQSTPPRDQTGAAARRSTPWDAGRGCPRPVGHQTPDAPRKPAALNTAPGHINASNAAAERVATMPDGLLSQEHEAALAAAKRKLREENEEYIRQPPELRGAIRLLMAKLLDDTPDDLQQYVCEFFTDPDLERKVEEFMLQKV